MKNFYDVHLRELADQQQPKVREQIEIAFLEDPPSRAADLDGWFEHHFHRAPVSHDTALFNRLQGMKDAIREALAD